ncbi:MAG TPA: glycosyltransferase family 4 protein [Phycisphaerae bacterium]|nr:glycosyltransferase family 4 protein [Phycisphaerae bacterium]
MDEPDQAAPAEVPVDIALCIDRDVYSRLWEVIQHLCVGLVDLTAPVRLLSSAAEAQALSLGPIEMIVHQALSWPFRGQRLGQILDVLSARPPTVVQAFSRGCFRVAEAVARAFEIDLVLHLSATADVRALQHVDGERVQHVIAASRPIYDLAAASGRVRREALSVIHPGVLRQAKPTCFGTPGRIPTVLCTAALDGRSGVGHLIEAVSILRDRGYELLSFLLGRGRAEGELRRRVHACKLSQWITFAQPKGETSRIMDGADIFVCPAPERALSSDSLTAMASGTAVVACAGSVADHCVDGETAVVCPDDSPEALADGVSRLLDDHEYARALAVAGLLYLKEHHPVSAMAEQSLALFRQLALRRRTFAMGK